MQTKAAIWRARTRVTKERTHQECSNLQSTYAEEDLRSHVKSGRISEEMLKDDNFKSINSKFTQTTPHSDSCLKLLWIQKVRGKFVSCLVWLTVIFLSKKKKGKEIRFVPPLRIENQQLQARKKALWRKTSCQHTKEGSKRAIVTMIKKTKKKKTHDLEVASAEMMLKLNLI